MVMTSGNPFHIQVNTTDGNASSLLPSQDMLAEMIPSDFSISFKTPYMGFMIQVNKRAMTASGKSHGSMKMTLNTVLPLNSLFNKVARIKPRTKCPITTNIMNSNVSSTDL